MTYTEKFTKLKDFNPEQLEKEVATLGLPEGYTIWFNGFDEDGDKVVPADLLQPRIVVKTPTIQPIAICSKATKGEVHVLTKVKLTAQQATDLEAKLDAHNSATKSIRQIALAQKKTDLATLTAKMGGGGVTTADLNLLARLLLEAPN